ncbi:reverse transcriptase domain, reverse transcriptase zinc-binding domain protein [Tanacetum coccineum]
MVKMVPHEAFACSCAEGDVVLRQSYKPESYGKLYYACPKSKPPKHFGCGFFLWKETRLRRLQVTLQDIQHLQAIRQGLQRLQAILLNLQHLQTIL